MSSYNELIKNFEKVRSYIHDFYIYGFKTREQYDKKSLRSYDDERRRIESWLGEYVKSNRSDEGKNIFIFDLGIIKDIEPENAPPCGCGHRAFVPKPPVDDVLKKLDMDKEEYSRLCAVLQRHLDFGLCKRCR